VQFLNSKRYFRLRGIHEHTEKERIALAGNSLRGKHRISVFAWKLIKKLHIWKLNENFIMRKFVTVTSLVQFSDDAF